MHTKQTRGSWTQESRALAAIQEKINLYQDDIAAHYQYGNLVVFIDKKTKMIAQIERRIQQCNPASFFYNRTLKLQQTIHTLKIQLGAFKHQILKAENLATQMVKKYKNELNRLISAYQEMHVLESLDLTKTKLNRLQRNLSYRVWHSTQKKLANFSKIQSLQGRQHNSLAQLLLANDTDFVDIITQDKITIEGEVGLLIIQRLQTIFYNSSVPPICRMKAIKKIKEIMAEHTPDHLLYYNEAILHQEITKLFLYAELHPHNKTAWLGTARAVDATIKNAQPTCIYFNPPRHYLTWGLNRFWLRTAVHLGYQFQLVEQHFPVIEKAILSQDPTKFLQQLLLETRGDSLDYTSQYNGHYSCTATNQEVLALMDMGCIAHKDEWDNSIRLTTPKKSYEEPLSLYLVPTSMFKSVQKRPFGRIHSTSDIRASDPPTYEEWTQHFVWNK